MSRHKIFRTTILIITLIACLLFTSCAQSKTSHANDNDDNLIENITSDNNDLSSSTCDDLITDRVSLGKNYYYLGYDGVVKTEYYTINQDGTATYTHIMKNGNTVTFHQIINFKWSYAGEGNCILVHNGTKVIKGEQDDAFGISRVMHLANDIIYWSSSGENTYYISEDFASKTPDYAKLIKE